MTLASSAFWSSSLVTRAMRSRNVSTFRMHDTWAEIQQQNRKKGKQKKRDGRSHEVNTLMNQHHFQINYTIYIEFFFLPYIRQRQCTGFGWRRYGATFKEGFHSLSHISLTKPWQHTVRHHGSSYPYPIFNCATLLHRFWLITIETNLVLFSLSF